MQTTTYRINPYGNTTKDSRPAEWFDGKTAVFTTFEGERIVGTVESSRSVSAYHVLRFADGKWARLDDSIEIVEG